MVILVLFALYVLTGFCFVLADLNRSFIDRPLIYSKVKSLKSLLAVALLMVFIWPARLR
jgi:hypothetical protein